MKPCDSRRKRRKTLMESDWSALPRDLLVVIAKLTMCASVEDFMAFGGVCSSWRSASREDEVFGVKSSSWPMMVPLLMLSEKKEGNREFYSVLRNKIFMSLPVPKTLNKKKYIESRFGWILTLACSGEIELMNPFTAERIQIPNYKTLPYYDFYAQDPSYDYILRSVLSANPSHTSDFVLVVTTRAYIAFWMNGTNHWTRMKSINGDEIRHRQYLDVNYFNRDGMFYAVTKLGDLSRWDAHAFGGDFTDVIPQVFFSFDDQNFIGKHGTAYLVESSTGELLLITRNGRIVKRDFKYTYARYGVTEFRVYRIDVINGVSERVTSLKNDAIFVGHNAAFSIPVSNHDAAILKSSSIYFTDDAICAYLPPPKWPNKRRDFVIENSDKSPILDTSSEEDGDEPWLADVEAAFNLQWAQLAVEYGIGDIDAKRGGGKDMGIYNLEDGSIQRFHPDTETLSFTCPPLWVAPSSFSWLR